MNTSSDLVLDPAHLFHRMCQFPFKWTEAIFNSALANMCYVYGFGKHVEDFINQSTIAASYFQREESKRIPYADPWETLDSHLKLWNYNLKLFLEGTHSSMEAAGHFHVRQFADALLALQNSFFGVEGTGLKAFSDKQLAIMRIIAQMHQKIIEIKSEYGFHFDDGNYELIDETDRFWVYQVLPFVDGESRPDLVDHSIKPVLIIPPYVLGPNILCFLRDRGKSFVHSFANKRIPTFIRIMKPIGTTIAVQKMTQEDDCLDTVQFCTQIMRMCKGRKVTLLGYCQGGYGALLNVLTGKLDDEVDSLVTCVAPVDGTFSKGLKVFLDNLSSRFNDLSFGIKWLESGIAVASGELMSYVYKVKSMGKEAPVASFYRNLEMAYASMAKGTVTQLSPTFYALNHWLLYDRSDIPLAITRISFDSYNIPIEPDGTMPSKVFGKTLNLHYLEEAGISYHIFFAEEDDLVEREVATAAQQYAQSVSRLRRGHVGGATSPKPDDPDGPVQAHLRSS